MRLTTSASDPLQPPGTHAYRHYEAQIKAWVLRCAHERCFCPADSESPVSAYDNMCEYLSSPGTDAGLVNETSAMRRLLRVGVDRNQRPVEERVAAEVRRQFGEELRRYCHLGKEPAILQLLLTELCGFRVDLRAVLGGVPVYNTAKHVVRLGLSETLVALCRLNVDKPDSFLRQFDFKSPGHVVVAQGLGVNMWALLLLGALVGTDDIHTKTSSKAATSILSQLLSMAPVAATPGGRCPVRSFNLQSGNPETVIVADKGQPEHFLRALHDDKFAVHGEFTYCPADNGLMPEDWLHCVHLLAASRMLFCSWQEVPPLALRGPYQLVPRRHYAVLRRARLDVAAATGTVCADAKGAVLRYEVEDGSEAGHRVALGLFDWQERLAELGFLIMPMVFRSGAAVVVRRGPTQIGCLVPSGTRRSMHDFGVDPRTVPYVGNFDPVRGGYHALVEEGTTVFMDPETAMNNLLPPGTVVWIKPGAQTWEDFKEQNLFPALPRDHVGDDIRAVRGRLNVPTVLDPTPGRLYVTVLQRKVGSSAAQECSYRTVTVDPDELVLEDDDGYEQIQWLVV